MGSRNRCQIESLWLQKNDALSRGRAGGYWAKTQLSRAMTEKNRPPRSRWGVSVLPGRGWADAAAGRSHRRNRLADPGADGGVVPDDQARRRAEHRQYPGRRRTGGEFSCKAILYYCLQSVVNQTRSNESLRARFRIEKHNTALATGLVAGAAKPGRDQAPCGNS